jgi:hypothetical protein
MTALSLVGILLFLSLAVETLLVGPLNLIGMFHLPVWATAAIALLLLSWFMGES